MALAVPKANTTRSDTLRADILDIITTLQDQSTRFSLPQPPEALHHLRRKLEENTYNVLVVGEAKRGKSSFINALIGRDLLPTDTHVATSQVFKVMHAERESYRIRFEDDSTQAISADDLVRFGSQVVADSGDSPSLSRIVRWIEVETPAAFLPPGVQLLDTPGLGTLYAGHAQITQRFVPLADAVIVVLDSSQPMTQPEVQLIEQLLGVTSAIMFIQTQIDLHGQADWRAIKERNEAILRDRFGERLVDTRVWPISSALLSRAAITGDEDYEIASRHRELRAALESFLFTVAGYARPAEALLLCRQQVTTHAGTLAARLRSAQEASAREREQLHAEAAQRQDAFAAEWGPNGRQRSAFDAQLRRLIGISRAGFLQDLQPGGTISAPFERRIDVAQKVEDLNAIGETLDADLVAAAVQRWTAVCGHLQRETLAALAPLAGAVAALDVRDTPLPSDFDSNGWQPVPEELDLGQRLQALRVEVLGTSSMTSVGLAGLVLTGVIAGPVAAAAGVVAAVWTLVRFWNKPEESQLATARQQLRQHALETLSRIRRRFLEVDLDSSRYSLVDEFLGDFERQVVAQVNNMTTQRLADAQAEVSRLVDVARMDAERRAAEATMLRAQVVEVLETGKRTDTAMVELEAIRAAAVAG